MIYNLVIPDMTCEHCKKRRIETVEAAGGRVDFLDLGSKKITVSLDLPPEKIVALIDEAGYTAKME